MFLSVIIPTKNRPEKIRECVNSIFHSSYSKYEIIVIDQSTNAIKMVKNNKLIYIHSPGKGKSEAINIGLYKARGDIAVFTDDDCIASTSWLKNIHNVFYDFPQTTGVFGRTLPFSIEFRDQKICPCTFEQEKVRIISKPCKHWERIGFGNNMAYRKEIFKTLGNFKVWLGPGSIGKAAEDAEFAQRVLISGNLITYTPKPVVFHNKWLTLEEMRKQNLSYICGEMTCYCYFYFQKYHFARTIILNNIHDSIQKIRKIIKNIILLRWDNLNTQEIRHEITESVFRTRGMLVGLFYSFIDPLH